MLTEDLMVIGDKHSNNSAVVLLLSLFVVSCFFFLLILSTIFIQRAARWASENIVWDFLVFSKT